MKKRKIKFLYTVFDFLIGFKLWLYNSIFNKIPFYGIRKIIGKFYFKIGKGSNVLSGVNLLNTKRNNITIGKNSVINNNCLLDGRVGKIIIGNNVDIARETNIFTLEHDPNSDYHLTKHGDVVIQDYVWVASRVTILPNVTIGKGAVVASGSVVTKDVEPMTIVGGVPAKKIGMRESKLLYNINYKPFFK